MNPADLSIRRPIFISCLVILMLAVGFISMRRLPVDMFPDVTFPVVMVFTVYPGAGPEEIETLVSKPIEDELSTLAGIKTVRSTNKEAVSTVIAEFTLETDIKYAEQQVRNRIDSVKRKLPKDIDEPIIRRIDPSEQPILILSLNAGLPMAKLFDLADQEIRPKLEQVNQVGLVEIYGGRKREIRIELDLPKLRSFEISAGQVASRIGMAGQNVPVGNVTQGDSEATYRSLGEFHSLEDIASTVVSFIGNDVPVNVKKLGAVVDSVEDETSRAFVNGKSALFLIVYRQSGANTVAVCDAAKMRVEKLNSELKNQPGAPLLQVVRDSARPIRLNVEDVRDSILLGIFLTILVVYLFLANWRSTVITGLALPNSLLGAFILMAVAGFTVNVTTLLALSLSVGLLIDDAIVVRENIFRHIEMGESPEEAARAGAREVILAVIATTLTVIAVFGPIGFLEGIVGQFMRQFGLTVCFAMAISLFDALTMAPMLSAYFVGNIHQKPSKQWLARLLGTPAEKSTRLQERLAGAYGHVLDFTLKRPLLILGTSLGIFLLSLLCVSFIPKSFQPAQDLGEFQVTLELSPGTSLDRTTQVATEADRILRSNPEVETSVFLVGSMNRESHKATFFVNLVPFRQRKLNTNEFKKKLRTQLTPLAYANPLVQDFDMIGGGMRPLMINIIGNDLKQLEPIAQKVFERAKNHPALEATDTNYREGRPEFQIRFDKQRAQELGISTTMLGQELRTLVTGVVPAVLRENGREYDIRVRLKEDQRNLQKYFQQIYIPNMNQTLIRLPDVAQGVETRGPADIYREDRGRVIQIMADVAAKGPGLAAAMKDLTNFIEKELKLPEGVRYNFTGQAKEFLSLIRSMIMAAALGILFIYLVLASLYESFVIPLTIMLVLPLAICGAFFSLLIFGKSLDLFSMIGCILLLGVATKNSILLVDCANQLIKKGVRREEAVVQAGKLRLRPILMTSFSLIAGMLPIALGLNEVSRMRTSMGVAIIGGVISSTLLSLVVVPASFSYIDRFRLWSAAWTKRIFTVQNHSHHE